MTTITYADLTYEPAGGRFLFCPVCLGEYSASKGDYFWARPDAIIRCCGEPMARVRRESALVEA